MKTLKHIGKIVSTGSRVLVAFRTIPGASDHALVIEANSLTPVEHDAIMKLVESDQAQESFEFGEILAIRHFPDGRLMLPTLHQEAKLTKVPTSDVFVTPTSDETQTILLTELNAIIAGQKNCAVDDLCTFVSGAPKVEERTVARVNEGGKDLGEPTIPQKPLNESAPLKASANSVLSDTDIARSYRSQADAMYKEAARLRKQADELDPPKKKVAKVKETTDA